jgi:hypothetical protein
MTLEERIESLTNWLLNVWDSIGEETTQADIINDFTEIIGDGTKAEAVFIAWFADHGRLLEIMTQAPKLSMNLMAYEAAVKKWVRDQLTPLTSP